MKCELTLTAEEILTLNEMAAHHPFADFRPRALGLLALGDGIPVREIAHILRTSQQTIYHWCHTWKRIGLAGILGGHTGGRPPVLTEAMVDTAVAAVCAAPMSLADIADCIRQAHPDAPAFSRDALVRALHSRRLSCQRTRLSLKKSAPSNSPAPKWCWSDSPQRHDAATCA